MLKLIFWCLLGVNVMLLMLGRGYLGSLRNDAHEPARMQNQLNAKDISLIPAAEPVLAASATSTASATSATPFKTVVKAAAPPDSTAATTSAKLANTAAPDTVPVKPSNATAPAAPAAVAKSTLKQPNIAEVKPVVKAREEFACTEIGNFTLADARRFETQVATLALGERLSRRSVPSQEISSYIVNIPPQGGKEGANKRTLELKELGLTNYFIMPDNSPMPWAISLGVFKTEIAAQNMLANLIMQGVQGARVDPRFASSKQVTFQFHDLDSATKARLDQVKAAFPAQGMHGC